MRLTKQQQTIIRQTVASIAGANARIIMFGSRLDDNARGGDLDLLVECDDLLSLMQRSRIKLVLESALVMPVDIIAIKRGLQPTAFQRIALATGAPLGGS